MANYNQLVAALVQSIDQRVTIKNTTDSIDPIDVGGSITDVPNTLLTALNTINEFNILGGNTPPTNQGVEDDIYIQYGTTFAFWKKDNNSWVQKVVIDLGINIVDGNINLQSSISGQVVTISAGQWGIDNVIYTKAVQDQFTLDSADSNFDRIDAVFANKLSTVHYVAGTASSNPDGTKPVTPSDEVIVCYIYVPSLASGNTPYISDSQTSVSPPSSPLIDKFITIEVDSSLAGSYEIDLSSELDLPRPTAKPFITIGGDEAQSSYLWNQSTKKIVGLPELIEGDVVTIYFVGRMDQSPPIIANTEIRGMAFGSAAGLQSYLITKGNTGAVVSNYYTEGGGSEFFTVSGINSLVSGTFSGSSAIQSFAAGDWLTGTIGGNCFLSCVNLEYFFAPNLSAIGLYALRGCASLEQLNLQNIQTINPGAFKDSTGLNNKTISLPVLVAPNGLGGSAGDDTVFEGLTGITLEVPTTFQTNNAGSPDGDIIYIEANGGTVNYV